MWCFNNNSRLRRIWEWVVNKSRRYGPDPSQDAWSDSSELKPFSYFCVNLHVPDHGLDSGSSQASSGETSYPEPRLIRLLRIIPTGPKELIACSIHVADLHDSHVSSYDALSYTWGPTTQAEIDKGMIAKRKYPILCNGGQLFVTENLFRCLQQLKADSYYDRDLWIDAICVNQDDHAERCQQVSIMADIYRSATRVIVWLGAADEFTQPAVDLITRLSQLSEHERVTIDPQAFDNAHNAQLLGAVNSAAHWRALALLFGRTWFTRAWVIQELVLARHIAVQCGACAFDWDDMVAVSHFLATRTSANTFRTHLFEDLDPHLLSYKNPTKLAAVKKDIVGGRGSVLLNSLIRCRSYDASNDRDKVYALLGLATPQDHEFPDALYPNYHRSVARLYTDVTKYLLESVEGLHVLAHAEGDDFKRIPGLPSWVPDWSMRADLGLRITGYTRYMAAGDLPCFKQTRDDGGLTFLGSQFDTISRIGETKTEVNRSKDCREWLEMLEDLEREHPERDNRDAFWRTLLADTGPGGVVPIKEPWEDGFYVWMNMKENPSVEQKQRAAEFETSFMHSLNLRLFRTARGNLGLGSQSCREGDLVWIVQGSRVPLILRPVASSAASYRLVGGTYLHGFMQGEALDGLEFGEIVLV
ncbi:Uu.00g102980.m01.CDS01 [Anthostomella pinea]|uniref:Uu.00g102980.m01.CDS01 n=1 Tax=Anthostomella pinea TaxID=933095 RepID=A0AAI8VDK0_9PEZI|nr:Uu.00g102980.m01.CDS01 [Anthostomella pinea]